MPRGAWDQGWVDESVYLVAYDPAWPAKYRSMARELGRLLAPWLTGGLHHVGSTAVPGIAAKPVIDILAGVASLEASRPCIDVLRHEGWWYAPYRTDAMHWFCCPSPQRREFHLHVAPSEGDWFRDEIAFRDHLRADPERASSYEALKKELALRYPDDREAYTDGKADFIRAVLQMSGAKARALASETMVSEGGP